MNTFLIYSLLIFTMTQAMIVFDLNGVLMKRLNKAKSKEIKEIETNNVMRDITLNSSVVFLRPNFKELILFLRKHKARYIGWTTAISSTVEELKLHLKGWGFEFEDILSQEYCDVGGVRPPDIKSEKWIKNLNIVAEKYKCSLKDCVLVDDSRNKSVEGQNFINVSEYNPLSNKEDRYLKELCVALHDYVQCNDDDCEYKKK
ncbi:hypothetical protein CWI36_1218p0010 [Hamiltosporidium magnivora]|uniref:FCP1 homology domain-containing protein n=1 Tax=Hamiltosporidium magnivora TaxID=148818 RepID=A0A4Q9L4D6_9MICR|nr:hypothetical protein CWI36_1218p0010 [Hamiltosporidium magnivora]